jgi:sugar phosphate isomerase/epimerase
VRLSFSTLGCPAWSLPAVIDAAGRLGYDGVELRFLEGDDALWARPELTGAGLRDSLARLRDAGLEVSCVDTRSFFHHPEPAAREAALDEAVRSIELAARLGASGIRVFGDCVQPGQDAETTRGWIADALARLGEAARPHGVEVWIESHGDFAAAPDTVRVLPADRAAGVGVLWDPANAFETGEAPADGLAVLGDRVRHVHLKDVARETAKDGRRGWVPRLPGRGEFAPERVLAALRAHGYDRWVSFEWEKRWHPGLEEPEVALPHFVRWAARAMRGAAEAETSAATESTARTLSRGRLEIEVHPDRASMGRAAAAAVSAHLRREVAVLADAEDGQGRPLLAQQGAVAPALRFRVPRFAGQAMEDAHGHVREQAVHQEAAEGGGVRGLHADVLVEVERGDAVPGDGGVVTEGGEELVLRGRGREDRGRLSVAGDLAPKVG